MEYIKKNILKNRYICFVVGLICMTAAGTQYMFSVYAGTLQIKLDYPEQRTINLVGTSLNFGMYFGIIPGFLYDKYLGRATALYGAIFSFVGYFGVYCASMHWISTNYILVCFFMFLEGNGSSSLYTAALANNMPKFSNKYRGIVTGVLVSMFGFSSAIFTEVYSFVFDSNVNGFLLFLSIALGSSGLLGVIFFYDPEPEKEEILKKKSENLAEIIDDEKKPINKSSSDLFSENNIRKSGSSDYEYEFNHTEIDVIAKQIFPPDEPIILNKKQITEVLASYGLNINVLQLFKNLNFYLMFVIFLIISGAGLTIINNLQGIVTSLGGEDGYQNNLVVILACFNFSGRIVAGIIADGFLKYISKSSILMGIIITMFTGMIVFFFISTYKLIVIGVCIVGFAYGGLFSIIPNFCYELFGRKYFGQNYNILSLAPAVSSYIFATLIAGSFYDHYGSKGANGIIECFGRICYGYTYSILYFSIALSAIACSLLIIRSRGLYYRYVKYVYIPSQIENQYYDDDDNQNNITF
eukprot:TRINITY_DN9366_c0_g1_i1.p1 TRINITY_DN9366_c0_g1~~TRINITY_DN9366_c0_g1_i1.p1  ORF type:complete len:525 (+),score=103.09 TRINITY_DN9366_c0_g1_i1:187-1761(+)